MSLVIFGGLAVVTLLAERNHPRIVLGFWALLGVLFSIQAFIHDRRKLSQHIAGYDDAIACGTCADREIRAKRMWELEEQEDEGACYAFELESGGVAFVTGQDFYASARFPNEDFSLVEFLDRNGVVMDLLIEKRGAKLTAERLITGKEREAIDIPEHTAFFNGTLEEVFRSLTRT